MLTTGIHGGADETTPVEVAHKFAKYINHHHLVVLEGASHKYNGAEHSNPMIHIAAEFMTACNNLPIKLW